MNLVIIAFIVEVLYFGWVYAFDRDFELLVKCTRGDKYTWPTHIKFRVWPTGTRNRFILKSMRGFFLIMFYVNGVCIWLSIERDVQSIWYVTFIRSGERNLIQ